jgi:hypothetical protein
MPFVVMSCCSFSLLWTFVPSSRRAARFEQNEKINISRPPKKVGNYSTVIMYQYCEPFVLTHNFQCLATKPLRMK